MLVNVELVSWYVKLEKVGFALAPTAFALYAQVLVPMFVEPL